MFGETTISYVKIGNHPIETTIYIWLFGVPGKDWFHSEWTLRIYFRWSLSPKFCLWDLNNKNLSTKAGSGSNMMTHYERFGVCIRWLVEMSGKDYEVLQLNLILNYLNQRKFGWETSELRSFIYFMSLHVFTIWLFHHKKFIFEKNIISSSVPNLSPSFWTNQPTLKILQKKTQKPI